MTSESNESTSAPTGAAWKRSVELSVVVPTFNERANVVELLARLEVALAGIAWEVIFVDDDSPDGTALIVRETARSDARCRGIHRFGRRGLSSACVEGMMASAASFLAVMDADLQHDETRLPLMLSLLKEGKADLVVGSRYAAGGGIGTWDSGRAAMSRFAMRLSRLVAKQHVSDPMSGFFMLRREVLDESVRRLSGVGFKILLDILASSPKRLRIEEVPYTFRERVSGESKLDSLVLWEYGMLLADKWVGRLVPVRFLSFAFVGSLGALFHLAVLSVLLKGFEIPFQSSQTSATVAAMILNFSVNNLLTYRDRRLRGARWFLGLLTFMTACSVGAFANVGIATYLFESRTWWMPAALAGVAVGAVWNFVVTQFYTWGDWNRRGKTIPQIDNKGRIEN